MWKNDILNISKNLVGSGNGHESNEMETHVEDGEESVQLLCCSFQKYLHCSESVVNTTCGYETARFTKSFLDRMSGPLIQVRNIFRRDNLNNIFLSDICLYMTLLLNEYLILFPGTLPSV